MGDLYIQGPFWRTVTGKRCGPSNQKAPAGTLRFRPKREPGSGWTKSPKIQNRNKERDSLNSNQASVHVKMHRLIYWQKLINAGGRNEEVADLGQWRECTHKCFKPIFSEEIQKTLELKERHSNAHPFLPLQPSLYISSSSISLTPPSTKWTHLKWFTMQTKEIRTTILHFQPKMNYVLKREIQSSNSLNATINFFKQKHGIGKTNDQSTTSNTQQQKGYA